MYDYHETDCAVFDADPEPRLPTSQTHRVLADIATERVRQDQLKAEGRFDYTLSDDPGLAPTEKLATLIEELGEVAREVQNLAGTVYDGDEGSVPKLYKELGQLAALTAAWMESIA
jgi:NTP pyrophosphatase (non-canonical NTP hydrolase)